MSLGKGKSDEKYPQKLKMMEREEKEFRKKFKVSFLHVKYKNKIINMVFSNVYPLLCKQSVSLLLTGKVLLSVKTVFKHFQVHRHLFA